MIAGADDMHLRVYNYNTMEKLKAFEAHTDYIRCLAVHPTQPYVLSSSDDMLIKLWDWEKGWQNTMVFEGHAHYVMMVTINPKDTNTFASASLDRTIKVWGLGSSTPHFTLEAHERGVNCVEYYVGGEKPYLISGSDDRTVKIWDYQHKTCVQTLEGHTHNVSVVCFHPSLQIIISGSEDGTVRIWHANTYRLEKTLNYGLERVWAMSYLKGSNKLALGYDEGTIMIKLASEAPAASMDPSGKVIWSKHNEIQTANVRTVNEAEIVDGERLPLAVRDLGSCEFHPAFMQHNSNGRFAVVCGDGEFIIYTALAWRNKTFGNGLDFAWASDRGDYSIRTSPSLVKIFKNFQEAKAIKLSWSCEGIFGGFLLGLRSSSFVCFYDWKDCRLIRKIEVCPTGVYWNDAGDLVTIATETSFYILRFNQEIVSKADPASIDEEEGLEEAFEVLHEIPEKVRTARWVGSCFLYTNAQSRLNYCVGGEVVTISHLDRKMYLLGYIPQNNRLYLFDKNLSIVSYTLHLSIINYQTAVLAENWNMAKKILPSIPKDQYNRVAGFLEAQGHKELALELSTDVDHKFELAIQLGRLDIAHEIVLANDSEQKWKQLADMALSACQFSLAQEALEHAHDLGGQLLIYYAGGNGEKMQELATKAQKEGKNNVAFVALFLSQKVGECIDLLVSTNRLPEAAFFARTYMPSRITEIVKLWQKQLAKNNKRAAEALADPDQYPNLFPDFELAKKVEREVSAAREIPQPSSSYPDHQEDLLRDLIQQFKEAGLDQEEEEIEEEVQEEQPEEHHEEQDHQPQPQPTQPQPTQSEQPQEVQQEEEAQPTTTADEEPNHENQPDGSISDEELKLPPGVQPVDDSEVQDDIQDWE